MSVNEDKRKYMRLGAFLEGTFQVEEGINGLVMLTDFSRGGLKACLNRRVDVGKCMRLEIWIPGSIIPVFAKGELVWIKKSSKEWTYQYDAGIKMLDIDSEDRQRMLDFAYEHWRKARGQI